MVSLIRANRGQSVVEFALVLPMLLLVLFGITELGRAVVTKNVLTSAAREGARLAIVTGPNEEAVRARVERVCAAAGVTPTLITIEGPDAVDRSVTVKVQTEFTIIPGSAVFEHYGGSLPGRITIGSMSVMRHEALQP
jgi:Flp pilus assembly protein TadG